MMTVDSIASMDLTTLFKSCMKTIVTRNKAMGVSLPQAKIFPSSTSQFFIRAKEIKSNIISHQTLLADHKKKYLLDSEMTDHERNYMEKVVATNLHIMGDSLKTLNLEVEGDKKGSKDACECRKNILSLLHRNMQQINFLFKEMKQNRKEKQKEKENLFKLQRPASSKKRPSSTEDPEKTSISQDSSECSQSDNILDQSNMESQESNHIEEIRHRHTPSPVEEEINNMLGELSSEEHQLLEQENLHLYKELMSSQEEVKQITRQVVELGQMQDLFTEKVDVQAHQIEKIQETILTSTENVKEGNEQVREAMRKDAGFRVWIMFFLIVMSCTLLFLDWYNG